MFIVNSWNSLYQNFWGKEAELTEEKTVYQLDQLEVTVDVNPIGGYRGKVGSLVISHIDQKIFTDWSDEDLKTLAKLERMILHIQEQAQVSNSLIFGRQDGEKEFKLSLIAYPKCDWIEKIQGLLHVIFGTPSLNNEQAEEIAQFYLHQFDENLDISVYAGGPREGKPDAFCRSSVIEEQRIADLSFDDENYHLLHDKWPKGQSAADPHLLIVPEENTGHCDGSQVSQDKRFHMLKIAQKAMQIFLQEKKYSTMLFLERNGEKLQGVQHKHAHVLGIEYFPLSFLEKIQALIRQIYTPALSHLRERIQQYQRYDWEFK